MWRKTFISLVATAALGAGFITMIDDAEAHRRHHNGGINIGFGFVPFLGAGYGYGYPGYIGYSGYGYRHYGYRNYGYRYSSYYDGYDDYVDCRYRRVAVKKWNKAHTRKIIVYKKKRVCY